MQRYCRALQTRAITDSGRVITSRGETLRIR